MGKNIDDQEKLSKEILSKATSLDDFSKQHSVIELLDAKTVDLESIVNLLTDTDVKNDFVKNIKYRKHLLKVERDQLTVLAIALKDEKTQKEIPYSFFTYQSEKELKHHGFNKQKEWDEPVYFTTLVIPSFRAQIGWPARTENCVERISTAL